MAYPKWDISQVSVRCRNCVQTIAPGENVWIKSKSVYYCNTCGLLAQNAPEEVKPGGIAEGLIKDLAQFPEEAADTSLAKAALYMAKQLDDGDVSPREVTQYTKELRLNLLQIRELYPPDSEEDDTDARRDKLQERRRREQGGI